MTGLSPSRRAELRATALAAPHPHFPAFSPSTVLALLDAADEAERLQAKHDRELADWHRHGSQSRRSICELSDRYKAERDVAVAQVDAVRRLCDALDEGGTAKVPRDWVAARVRAALGGQT